MIAPARTRRLWQGSLPLVVGALLACATSASPPAVGADTPGWARRPPPGCAVGFSGPTLDPGDAIRRARRAALESLATSWLGVRVVSELHVGSSRAREWSLQETRGVLARSRIVVLGVGRDYAMRGARPRREVFALACPADLPTPILAPAEPPDWLLDAGRRDGRLCALGVAGPTRRPHHQEAAALRDGQRALAEAIELRVQQRSFDPLRGPLRVVSQSEASERAIEISSDVEALEERWLDERGSGPLRRSGVLYGLICAYMRGSRVAGF